MLLGLFVLVALVWLFSSASFLSALPGLGPLGLVYGGFMVAWVVALVVQSMWLLKAGKAFGRVSEVGLSGELKLAFSRLRDVMIAEVAIGVLLSFGRVVTSLFGLPLL
ncbi:hypothetical protein G6O69_19255 [Pseudenhygromyxa sp. WMMC2535]|uniref:hypothetical protein n=1 Tax=Pseudenhygromyxa sp. WMMC2535 TaxID=2712867 RepID=UPI001595A7DE|nr:hypothetical protein [Pseudenhygromyxa sp. WMMC2535]NVB39991.1 hypothetical protein [Pseudenhygromyxa sp. WMMC2535]